MPGLRPNVYYLTVLAVLLLIAVGLLHAGIGCVLISIALVWAIWTRMQDEERRAAYARWRRGQIEKLERLEFGADYDAMQAERAAADRAQIAAIAAVRNGPGQHEGQEL